MRPPGWRCLWAFIRRHMLLQAQVWSLEEKLMRDSLRSLLYVSECCYNIEMGAHPGKVCMGKEEIHINGFSCCSDKMPGRVNLTSVIIGKLGRQGHEAAGHTVSTARNQSGEGWRSATHSEGGSSHLCGKKFLHRQAHRFLPQGTPDVS